MKGITSRLQVFLAKIAGKEVDVSTLTPPVAINEEEKLMLDIADRIDAIEEGGGGGGAGLPDVTSDDNGDVLTVVEGAWDKAAPSGGGSDIFVMHFEVTLDEDTQSVVVTCDKTPAEIVAAGDAGKLMIAKALMWETYPEEASIKLVTEMQGSDPYINIEFLGIYYESVSQASSNDRLSRANISWDVLNNRWRAEGANYQLTPAT